MIWVVVRQVFSTRPELIQIGRLSDQEKDLEILVLRKQLAMMERSLRPLLADDLRFLLIEVGTRRVHFASCTTIPNEAWITQQARQMVWELEEHDPAIQFLIRDNETKFSVALDTVFRSEGIDQPHCFGISELLTP